MLSLKRKSSEIHVISLSFMLQRQQTYLFAVNADIVPLIQICIDLERLESSNDNLGCHLTVELLSGEMDGVVDISQILDIPSWPQPTDAGERIMIRIMNVHGTPPLRHSSFGRTISSSRA